MPTVYSWSQVFDDADAIAAALCDAVEFEAQYAIEAKGAFSLAIPSGSVVKALGGLAGREGVDFSKVHVFFTNENLAKFNAYEGLINHNIQYNTGTWPYSLCSLSTSTSTSIYLPPGA
jgi:6-phosphogluconolactonase/glucosamine-6-phosphate isomerase/deaminase